MKRDFGAWPGLLLVIMFSLWPAARTFAAQPPAWQDAAGRNLVPTLERLLGLPYRDDGARDEQGRWVTFNRPNQVSPAAGFNCSGFVVDAARALLGRNFSLAEVSRDREADSGPGSPWGADWDFGLDLILNLAEGRATAWRPEPGGPQGAPPRIPWGPRLALGWGTTLHGREFEDILALIQPGHFAFFVLSRPDARFPAGVAYYHVGLIIPEPPRLWLYHVTQGLGTHRINLAEPAQLARFRRHFPPPARGERRILLLEVAP